MSFDNQPLRYYGRTAVYLTTYLAIALAVGTLVTLLFEALALFLTFSTAGFLRGFLWQAVTYPLVNPVNFFTPFSIWCFYSWGLELEQFFGRRRFVWILLALLLVPVGFELSVRAVLKIDSGLATDEFLVYGLLIAFATLFPDLDYLGGWVPLKWFAFACVFCGSLTYFKYGDWLGLSALWLDCFVGFASVQLLRGNFALPAIKLPSFRRKPKLRVVSREEAAASSVSYSSSDEVDDLLDKIARTGLNSLTAAERKRLERARKNLLKKTD